MIRNILSKLNFDDVQNDGNGHWRMYWLVEESAQWIIRCGIKFVGLYKALSVAMHFQHRKQE